MATAAQSGKIPGPEGSRSRTSQLFTNQLAIPRLTIEERFINVAAR
jgi:hypothetical protein